MKVKKIHKWALAAMVLYLIVSAGYKFYDLWPYRNTINYYLWFKRPDLAWAFEFIDEADKEWRGKRAEVAVWYLVRSESEDTYAQLRNRLVGDCFCEGCLIPKGYYAARILGQKDSVKSAQVLNDRWMGPSLDIDSCGRRALRGLAMKGETMAPFMLMVARDSAGDYYLADRYDALLWLGLMIESEDEEFSYCIEEGACEPLGPEITEGWVGTLIDLLGDPDPEIRERAVWVLLKIGEEQGVEAAFDAADIEKDEGTRGWMERAIERYLESNP